MARHFLMLSSAVALGLAAFASSANAGVITIANASFELPVQSTPSPNNFTYRPTGAGWIFAGQSGVAGSGGPWFVGNPPDGVQAGFIQNNGAALGSISQDISGLTAGATYTLSFSLAQRDGSYGKFPADPISVSYNGVIIAASITPPSTSFTKYSFDFTASADSGTLLFQGLVGPSGDNDTAIDAVSLVPEPASMALLGGGIAAVGLLRRKRR